MDTNEQPIKNKSKKLNVILISVIVVMVIAASAIIVVNLINKDDKKEENTASSIEKKSENNYYNYDYKYILMYDYLNINYFIYLLENDEIKVVSKENVYEICKEQDCIKQTDEIKYEEHEITLNEKALKKARNVISSYFTNSDLREIDLKNYNLDSKARVVLDGIVSNDSDLVTLIDDLKIDSKEVTFKDKTEEIKFSHTYSYVVESDNRIVKKIGEHLNKIVSDDFKQIEEDSNELLKQLNPEFPESYQGIGLNLDLKIECLKDAEVSISYITSGGMGGVGWLSVKGYVYNSGNGEIREYFNGKKEASFKNAMDAYKKMDIYTNEDARNQLIPNYEEKIYEEMFKVGNYYVTEDKVIFAIDGSLLGYNEATCKSLNIEIDKKDNF